MTPVDQLLAWIQGPGQNLLWPSVLCFFRTGSFFALLPALGEQLIPMRLRLGAAVAMTIIVAPALMHPASLSVSALLAEAVIGLMIGIGFRLFLLGLQTAGMMAAQAASLAQVFAGAGAEPQSGISNLLSYAGLALLCAAGLPVEAARLLIHSYEILPQGQWPMAADATTWGVEQVSRSFGFALSLAAPFLISALLYNAALGAINRAMPVLMVALIGAPALTLGSLVLLALSASFLLDLWLSAVQNWLSNPFPGPGIR